MQYHGRRGDSRRDDHQRWVDIVLGAHDFFVGRGQFFDGSSPNGSEATTKRKDLTDHDHDNSAGGNDDHTITVNNSPPVHIDVRASSSADDNDRASSSADDDVYNRTSDDFYNRTSADDDHRTSDDDDANDRTS